MKSGTQSKSSEQNRRNKPRSETSYELTRFNATKHGLLSQHDVLPWENEEEYRGFVEQFVAYHKPQGPAEECAVLDLARGFWRIRRLWLAEHAIYLRSLSRVTDYQGLGMVEGPNENKDSIEEAMKTEVTDTLEEYNQLEYELTKIQAVLTLCESQPPPDYFNAFEMLPDYSRRRWTEALKSPPRDDPTGAEPYRKEILSLVRFLREEWIPCCDELRRERVNRLQVRVQVYGATVDLQELERLSRYRATENRQLQRAFEFLLRMQEHRRWREHQKLFGVG